MDSRVVSQQSLPPFLPNNAPNKTLVVYWIYSFEGLLLGGIHHIVLALYIYIYVCMYIGSIYLSVYLSIYLLYIYIYSYIYIYTHIDICTSIYVYPSYI